MSCPGSAADEPSADAVAGRVTAELLGQSHLMRPAGVAGALARAARPLGVSGVQVYLADLQQRHLQASPVTRSSNGGSRASHIRGV